MPVKIGNVWASKFLC